MTDEFNPAEKVREFIAGLSTNPNLPNLKTVVGKLGALPGVSQLNSLPGVAQFKSVEVEILKIQKELLNAQMRFLDQLIEAFEAAPEEEPAHAEKVAPRAKKAAAK